MRRTPTLIAVLLMVLCSRAMAADPTACVLKNTGVVGSNQMFMPFPAALKRGVNVAGWWGDTQEYTLSADDIHRIHTVGFDFVRVPVSPVWLEMADSKQQAQKLEELHCDVVALLNEGLTVIIDLQPSMEYKQRLFSRQEDIIPHIERLWRRMQPVVTDLPSWRIYLEVFNEPLMDSQTWWHFQEKIIDDIRPSFTGNTLIASPGPFNGWWQLSDKVPYKDVNIIYDVHFYEPIYFAHHGDGSDPSKPPSTITYPVDKLYNYNMDDPEVQKYVSQDWGPTAISVILREVQAWKDHYNAITVCLEFGVYKPYMDNQSRYNWLRDVHTSLESINIPWAVWSYRGPYGILDDKGNLDTGMVDALNLKKSSVQ